MIFHIDQDLVITIIPICHVGNYLNVMSFFLSMDGAVEFHSCVSLGRSTRLLEWNPSGTRVDLGDSSTGGKYMAMVDYMVNYLLVMTTFAPWHVMI